jgi:hypothetical protein
MGSYENVFLILNNKLKINVMTSEDSLCGILNVSSAERVKAHYEGASRGGQVRTFSSTSTSTSTDPSSTSTSTSTNPQVRV